MDPCSVCKHGVHHLSSCVEQWKKRNTSGSPNAVSSEKVTYEIVGWSKGTSLRQQASQDSSSTVTEPEEPLSSQSTVDDSAEPRVRVDAYGIPMKVHFYRQIGKRDKVLDVAHVLATPYSIGNNDNVEVFTHICVLCALCLPMLQVARLPYNIVDFRRLVEVTTGNRDVTILSCDTFNDMLSSSFARFCEMVARLLDIEFRLKFKMPFLNLIHDLWTTGTGKKGVIGTSISFIDSNRDFRHFAMLVRILNYFHESKLVKEMIMSRIAELYGVAIDGMAQFLMSDTAPSTRKVSKLFEDAIPVDYTMYVLNLRLRSTVGCAYLVGFSEGAALAKKVRGLIDYFKCPERVERLKKGSTTLRTTGGQYYGEL
ncbi:hypothetical protein PC120_g931 [Phytophthora cactorum]|nr:hypothetical protein PC120_g931 [Phytophthora cactorum]